MGPGARAWGPWPGPRPRKEPRWVFARAPARDREMYLDGPSWTKTWMGASTPSSLDTMIRGAFKGYAFRRRKHRKIVVEDTFRTLERRKHTKCRYYKKLFFQGPPGFPRGRGAFTGYAFRRRKHQQMVVEDIFRTLEGRKHTKCRYYKKILFQAPPHHPL